MCLFIFIGDLHDSVILLLPESFKVLLSCAIRAFVIETSLDHIYEQMSVLDL